MAQLNALWWWIDRWRKSTAYTDMTVEQQGAYRNLLDEAWLRGGVLPNDERILAKACGDACIWKRVRVPVLARFTVKADGLHNATLDEVRRQSQRRADNQRRYRARMSHSTDNGAGNATDNGVDNGVDNGPITNAITARSQPDNKRDNKPDSPSPSLSQYKDLKDARSVYNPPPVGERARPGSPIHDTSHKKHAHCGRICMAASLLDEFMRRRNHANAYMEITNWALKIDQAWSEGGPCAGKEPGDAFAFWRARYDEQWPPAPAKPAAIGQVYVAAKDHPYGSYKA